MVFILGLEINSLENEVAPGVRARNFCSLHRRH